MKDLLYLVAVIVIIAWAVGFLAFHTGPFIHTLLAVAAVIVLLRLLMGRESTK